MYCCCYNYSELTRCRLLRGIASKNDRLLMCISEFKEALDFVTVNVKEKYTITSLYEVLYTVLLLLNILIQFNSWNY
jgi:putative component of membrane protein insertase Oxa1/YidC/SpoIIIJ protein YidD